MVNIGVWEGYFDASKTETDGLLERLMALLWVDGGRDSFCNALLHYSKF